MTEYTIYFGTKIDIPGPDNSKPQYMFLRIWFPTDNDVENTAALRAAFGNQILYAAKTNNRKHEYSVIRIGWNSDEARPDSPNYWARYIRRSENTR